MHWVRGVYNCYRFKGDRKLVQALLPTVDRVLRWYVHYQTSSGVLKDVAEWNLVDWSSVLVEDTSTILTAVWARALRELVEIAAWLDEPSTQRRAEGLYERAKARFEVFWVITAPPPPQPEVNGVVQATTAPFTMADPAPLGLAAFAMTTAMLSGVNAGVIHSGALVFVGVALLYGGVAQFAAGMWEFRKGNTFGATAFTSYAAFWMSLGILEVFDHVAAPSAPLLGHEGLIWFLAAWGVFTACMWVASLRTSGALVVTFGLLLLTFAALWIGELNGDAAGVGWTNAGGWLGLVTAIVAAYTSFAALLSSTFGKSVLPTFPVPTSR